MQNKHVINIFGGPFDSFLITFALIISLMLGKRTFILTEDLDFSSPSTEKTAIKQSSNDTPTGYAYKAYGKIISGELKQKSVVIGDYEKFLKIQILV